VLHTLPLLSPERIDYDGQTYHTTCFKCLQCRNVISLSAVAMIKGDLYCKNCFMRIFKSKGQYSSFGDKTLPKAEAERARSATTTDAPSASPPSSSFSPSPSASPSPPPSSGASAPSASERRGSTMVLTCVVADCKQPRVPRKNYCFEHVNSAAAAEPEAAEDLAAAIASKNVDKVAAILAQEKTADLLLRPNAKGVTPIEQAFTGIANSRACGEKMIDWLRAHVAELEKNKAAQ